jgi:SAM-dependent methyltransferase
MCDWREATLGRFEEHRRAWRDNAALWTLYERWYGRVRDALPPGGPWLELGSGPGFAREFIPGLILSDVVRAPWHDGQMTAEALPCAPGSLGALVLFDVLHHMQTPANFFAEATRVLRPGGRVVLCEPYVSVLSYPVYRFFHDEGLDFRASPFEENRRGSGAAEKNPFEANQAIPTLLFGRQRAEFERRFPALRIIHRESLGGLSYPASGGFSRRPLLPLPLWRGLLAIEERLPSFTFRLFGFRLLVVLERA